MLLLRHRPCASVSPVEAALELGLGFAGLLCVTFLKSLGRSVRRGERNGRMLHFLEQTLNLRILVQIVQQGLYLVHDARIDVLEVG